MDASDPAVGAVPDPRDYEQTLEHLRQPRRQSWLPHDPVSWLRQPSRHPEPLSRTLRDLPGNTVMAAIAGLLRRWLPTYELMLADLEPGSFTIDDPQFVSVPGEWHLPADHPEWLEWKESAREAARHVVDELDRRARGGRLGPRAQPEQLLDTFRFLGDAVGQQFGVWAAARRLNWIAAFGQLSLAWLNAIYGIRSPRSEWARSRSAAFNVAYPISRALFYLRFGAEPARHDRELQKRAEQIVADQIKDAMPLARGTISGHRKAVGGGGGGGGGGSTCTSGGPLLGPRGASSLT